jgi:adenine-specific DNA-methyltransferase
MAGKKKTNGANGKKVTRYTYNDVKEPRSPETGHTSLLPADELTVTLPMDNGWGKNIQVGRLPEGDVRPIVIDMDPAQDPILFWAGKRNKREIPILPLQRNEIVSESRIAQIIDRAKKAAAEKDGTARQGHLFADLERTLRESEKSQRVEFYTHQEGWRNKLICGDSLQVIESLLHYEGLRGKVQMVYMDPPYGIKYDSNFQQRVDSTKNEEKDQADDVLSIKAFRDTWALGVHSYLSYLQERLYLSRELLTSAGSIFVQIGEGWMHLVRDLLDEVFGAANGVRIIPFRTTAGLGASGLAAVSDYLLWYAKDAASMEYFQLYTDKSSVPDDVGAYSWIEAPDGSRRKLKPDELFDLEGVDRKGRRFRLDNLTSGAFRENTSISYEFEGKVFHPGQNKCWKTTKEGLDGLAARRRLQASGNTLTYVRFLDDFPLQPLTAWWDDTATGGYVEPKFYAVQTNSKVVSRCLLMTTKPGDIVLDPTCGSGTTATCAERLGRRWITCDTSRVALNVARQRLLSSTFDHFRVRNGVVSGGFVYKTVPRVTLKSAAYGLEPERVEIVDRPEIDPGVVRICGPFEVMSIGRYSIEDWKGYVLESGKLANYIDVICRLYRKDAGIQGSSGLVHAISETQQEKIAISVGPLAGRVTGKQINDAVQDALASGVLEVHVLGWAFEANVGEIKSQLEGRGKVKVELVMIRPDTLAEGLKVTKPDTLFSPLALPDLQMKVRKNGKEGPQAEVSLRGVAVFDRKTRATDYKAVDSGYVAAWYLDEDYDGDCFVDCQMFFDFKKAPNLKATLRAEVDPEEFKLQAISRPFPVRGYKRIAVKVVDVFGNESTVVKDLA